MSFSSRLYAMAKNEAPYHRRWRAEKLRRGYRPFQEWLSTKQIERLLAMAKVEGRSKQQMFRRIIALALGDAE